MPRVERGESRSKFIRRCVPIVLKEKRTKGQDHAVAKCNGIWEQSHRTDNKHRNPLRADPTRTTTLRRRLMARMRVRFRQLKGDIRRIVIEGDWFGLRPKNQTPFRPALNFLAENTKWASLSPDAKLAAFQQWLQQQINAGIITQKNWMKPILSESYEKGLGRAFDDVKKAASHQNLSFFEGSKQEFLRTAFGGPVAVEKVEFLATKSFTSLKGITNTMSQQISDELATGMIAGLSPREIARNINNRVDKIGRTRALTLARTEIVRAHAEGQLDGLEKLGVEKIGVMVEWDTAGDDRVCPLCSALSGAVMTIKEARGIIPRHANCRCAFIPANVGEGRQKGQKKSKSAIDKSIRTSVKREFPGKSVAQARTLTAWPGAGKKIAKHRPKTVFDQPGDEIAKEIADIDLPPGLIKSEVGEPPKPPRTPKKRVKKKKVKKKAAPKKKPAPKKAPAKKKAKKKKAKPPTKAKSSDLKPGQKEVLPDLESRDLSTFDKGTTMETISDNIGGSTGAKLVRVTEPGQKKGRLYIAKDYGGNALQARNEFLANRLYSEFADDVPISFLGNVDGKLTVFNEFIDDAETLGKLRTGVFGDLPKDLRDKLGDHFVVDSWLANWDVVGLNYDNIVVVDDLAFRIDNGGSLLFRAQGARKGKLFKDTVDELDTLRDSAINPTSAEVFKEVTPEKIVKQIDRLESKLSGNLTRLDRLVDDAGFSADDAALLKAKLADRYSDLIKRRDKMRKQLAARKKTNPNGSLQDKKGPIKKKAGELEKEANKASLTTNVVYLINTALRESRREAVQNEANAVGDYTGGSYNAINKKVIADQLDARTDALDEALDKLPGYEGWVGRGHSFEPDQKWKKWTSGEWAQVWWKSYSSTSASPNAVFDSGEGRGILFIIKSKGKQGAFVQPVSSVSREIEVMMRRNSRFRVTGWAESAKGVGAKRHKRILVLEEADDIPVTQAAPEKLDAEEVWAEFHARSKHNGFTEEFHEFIGEADEADPFKPEGL